MIAQRIEDSVYPTHVYNILKMTENGKLGERCDINKQIDGIPIYNNDGKMAAMKYNKDGIFHFNLIGGRFSTFAIQLTTYGKLDYRLYVSIDGVHWDDKISKILFDYVDQEKFNLGHITGGTENKPETDVVYFHVIGRLHYKLEITNSEGEYFILSLD